LLDKIFGIDLNQISTALNYHLIKQVIHLVEVFDKQNTTGRYSSNIDGFRKWMSSHQNSGKGGAAQPDWEGKASGRSPESVIVTLLNHLNRYARNYSRSAIHNSAFTTQDEYIYLINLQASGPVTKMQLIKKNVHDKPAGMQIISRLIDKGWVTQQDSADDKRSKVISITDKGKQMLKRHMPEIRKASRIVTGDLTEEEKTDLIRLLQKLENFHQPVFQMNLPAETLLDTITETWFPEN
jgi:DNA-binding MarR family transcriptional regulator